MKYPYRVIKNNILYRAGEEVPEDNEVKTENPEIATDAPEDAETTQQADEDAETTQQADEDAENNASDESKEEKHEYTRTEINRMNTASLHELAKTFGIEGEADKSGAQLKADIIEKLGL